jgi:hypothetical protein
LCDPTAAPRIPRREARRLQKLHEKGTNFDGSRAAGPMIRRVSEYMVAEGITKIATSWPTASPSLALMPPTPLWSVLNRGVCTCSVHAANLEVDVKYQFGAAVAALAIALVPGTVAADPASSTVLATNFAMVAKVLSGLDTNFASQKLRHTAATTHHFAKVTLPPDPYVVAQLPPDPYLTQLPPDPYLTQLPPDPYQPAACRKLALVWNVAVYQNRTQTVFDGILKVAAVTSCTLQVSRAAVPNADGSSDLISVTFAPQ